MSGSRASVGLNPRPKWFYSTSSQGCARLTRHKSPVTTVLASRLCRTLACKPFLPCRPRICSGKCASPRPTAKFTAAPKPSSISQGKSGGPGLRTWQPSCPASRAFSTLATAGLPITRRARLDCVPCLQRIAIRHTGGNHESLNSLVVGGQCCAVGDHCSRFRSAEKYLSCHEKLARVSRDEDVATCQSLVLMTKQFSTGK